MKKKFLISILFFAAVFFASRVFAINDQNKTTESFVASSETSISSLNPLDAGFLLYIGDNLAGVTDPIKSVYFPISGSYTGSGTLELKIDGDIATSKIFTMPDNSSGNATPFELIYKDETAKINPSSAGEYSYTLNIIPSGITIYGLGAKVKETHRYAPPSCQDGQSTKEKNKTTESFVASSETSISSLNPLDAGFLLYIGDNLAGVTDPIKSVYFPISGSYTGSGTLELKIDGDIATSKIFTMPDTQGNATPFELIYKDETAKINPSSAGEYSYTLNIIPSGITIYGLGAKVKETHRYKPPPCGGYAPFAILESSVFDSGTDGAAYNSVMWKGALGGTLYDQGKVLFQIATSNSVDGPWNDEDYYGSDGVNPCGYLFWYDTGMPPDGGSNKPVEITCAPQYHNNQRYFRYKIKICSDDCVSAGAYTPEVQDVVVSWSP